MRAPGRPFHDEGVSSADSPCESQNLRPKRTGIRGTRDALVAAGSAGTGPLPAVPAPPQSPHCLPVPGLGAIPPAHTHTCTRTHVCTLRPQPSSTLHWPLSLYLAAPTMVILIRERSPPFRPWPTRSTENRVTTASVRPERRDETETVSQMRSSEASEQNGGDEAEGRCS